MLGRRAIAGVSKARRTQATTLMLGGDEARRIAANAAKLPELLKMACHLVVAQTSKLLASNNNQ